MAPNKSKKGSDNVRSTIKTIFFFPDESPPNMRAV